MPNWSNTLYVFFGKEEDLKEAEKVINQCINPRCEENKGKSTYQLLGKALGKEYDDFDARNDFEQADLNEYPGREPYLQVQAITAWSPSHDLWDLVAEKFHLTYLFDAEDGDGNRFTNDKEGKFFDERFIILQDGGVETAYWKTETEALKDLESRTSKLCKTIDNAQSIIEEYNSTNGDSRITFTKIEVV